MTDQAKTHDGSERKVRIADVLKVPPPSRVILTESQAAVCQAEYERLLAEHEAKRVGDPNPMEYYTIKALWARAYGADQVEIVKDPVVEPAAK